MELMCFEKLEQHQHARAKRVGAALERGLQGRDRGWTESLAVGSDHFVEGIKQALGMKGCYREVTGRRDAHMLREPTIAYSRHFGHQMGPLSAGNGLFWEQS